MKTQSLVIQVKESSCGITYFLVPYIDKLQKKIMAPALAKKSICVLFVPHTQTQNKRNKISLKCKSVGEQVAHI